MSHVRSAATSFAANRKGARPSQSSGGEATQYSDEAVVFRHEFTLGAASEVYPAGRYTIETARDAHDVSGHEAKVRKSTMLIVPTASGTRAVQVQACDVETALRADAEREQLNVQNENPDGAMAAKAPREMLDSEDPQAQLERLKIERVPADVFVWRGYRYSNASDAIAAANRATEA